MCVCVYTYFKAFSRVLTFSQIDRQTEMRERETERDRERERETDRQTDRQR